jgi:hypothetical protein
MSAVLEWAIFLCGLAQFCILFASSLVPFRLNWKEELRCLSPFHRQMYWVYGGYYAGKEAPQVGRAFQPDCAGPSGWKARPTSSPG